MNVLLMHLVIIINCLINSNLTQLVSTFLSAISWILQIMLLPILDDQFVIKSKCFRDNFFQISFVFKVILLLSWLGRELL